MRDWLLQLFRTYFKNYLPYIVVFTASLYNSADSDLGWHLKYGEYFFKYGRILRENIFSSEMPGYRWINSSWATDILTYLTFHHFGFLGISVLGAIIITLTFFFFTKAAKLNFWQQAFIFPLIIYLEQPLFEVSFRGHLLTLLFISILYYLISLYEKNKKEMLFFVLPLFWLWSNFHGEFILGLSLFALFILVHLVSRILAKKVWLNEVIYLGMIFVFTTLTTIINPFGGKIYLESLRHFGNPLQQYIIEWLPFNTYSIFWWNLIGWGIILLISLLIIIRHKKFADNLVYIVPTLILFFFSFWMRRYAWPMYIISILTASHFFNFFLPKKKTIALGLPIFIFVFYYLFVIFVKNPAFHLQSMSWDNYCYLYVKCSPGAAQYLIDNKPEGKLLSFYNWGGWLIWKYPDIKPTIDGRMHLWRDKNGYSSFEKYYPLEQNWVKVDKSDYDIVFMPPFKPIHKQMMELVKEKKWKILYQDEYAYIFSRIERSGKAE